eukprot:TRINITY_DN12799_c0_g1_i1.p1 TRINITY_DN12799_c0_g1~~TRINITY_DN12799_c0_g1_i1.p1  ORF type:complete len:547 (+),score=105.10 TRINITY_DN12799_c0_g1_i1:153-1793(+)
MWTNKVEYLRVLEEKQYWARVKERSDALMEAAEAREDATVLPVPGGGEEDGEALKVSTCAMMKRLCMTEARAAFVALVQEMEPSSAFQAFRHVVRAVFYGVLVATRHPTRPSQHLRHNRAESVPDGGESVQIKKAIFKGLPPPEDGKEDGTQECSSSDESQEENSGLKKGQKKVKKEAAAQSGKRKTVAAINRLSSAASLLKRRTARSGSNQRLRKAQSLLTRASQAGASQAAQVRGVSRSLTEPFKRTCSGDSLKGRDVAASPVQERADESRTPGSDSHNGEAEEHKAADQAVTAAVSSEESDEDEGGTVQSDSPPPGGTMQSASPPPGRGVSEEEDLSVAIKQHLRATPSTRGPSTVPAATPVIARLISGSSLDDEPSPRSICATEPRSLSILSRTVVSFSASRPETPLVAQDRSRSYVRKAGNGCQQPANRHRRQELMQTERVTLEAVCEARLRMHTTDFDVVVGVESVLPRYRAPVPGAINRRQEHTKRQHQNVVRHLLGRMTGTVDVKPFVEASKSRIVERSTTGKPVFGGTSYRQVGHVV